MVLINKDNEKESRSGSETEQENTRKKRRHHRHTAQQIQELEALFKECRHPDENQRMELSRRISLDSQQVKFWFQNRRTQNKTKTERHENSIVRLENDKLRVENDKLRVENATLREAMRNPLCNNCRGNVLTLEEQHLRIENALLKDELDRVSALAGNLLGRPISHHSELDLAGAGAPTLPAVPEFVSGPDRDHTGMADAGRRSMLRLAQRMTESFCTIVSASSAQKWTPVRVGGIGEDVRVMIRQSLDDPGETPGLVLSASTSVWLPVAAGRLFDFLRDGRRRSEWDVLSNGGPMPEMAHIVKGQEDHGNAVTLLSASSVLILQETCTYSCGSGLVVYSPVDIASMDLVMKGGDSDYVALLPSGLAVAPEGPAVGREASINGRKMGGGSRLTLTFQILVDSLPSAKLTEESVGTVNKLMACTVQQIKAAFHCGS